MNKNYEYIQIEYCHPPFKDVKSSQNVTDDLEIPSAWETLPSLAIPDGAHNVESDIIYFILPSRSHQNRSVYGISCYRQIPADAELRELDATVTRSSVQKSVCVLSRVPLFGVLSAKLELITQTYFNEKNFSKASLYVSKF